MLFIQNLDLILHHENLTHRGRKGFCIKHLKSDFFICERANSLDSVMEKILYVIVIVFCLF
jgi:hypothetical protein